MSRFTRLILTGIIKPWFLIFESLFKWDPVEDASAEGNLIGIFDFIAD